VNQYREGRVKSELEKAFEFVLDMWNS